MNIQKKFKDLCHEIINNLLIVIRRLILMHVDVLHQLWHKENNINLTEQHSISQGDTPDLGISQLLNEEFKDSWNRILYFFFLFQI